MMICSCRRATCPAPRAPTWRTCTRPGATTPRASTPPGMPTSGAAPIRSAHQEYFSADSVCMLCFSADRYCWPWSKTWFINFCQPVPVVHRYWISTSESMGFLSSGFWVSISNTTPSSLETFFFVFCSLNYFIMDCRPLRLWELRASPTRCLCLISSQVHQRMECYFEDAVLKSVLRICIFILRIRIQPFL